MALVPIFLKAEGALVVVVGAGPVGTKKALEWTEAGACVRVVAPAATSELVDAARARRLEHREKAFDASDLEGAFFVVAATNDARAQSAIAEAARARGLFVNAIDDLPNASAYAASTIRRAPFTIAIQSGGEAPALTRLLREILESALPAERWIAEARAMRARWKREGTPMEARFPELLDAFTRSVREAGGG
jgi:uroporphyrin-III C-methyltransferase/precorrin-2 dehydrogenase/sirohydrochlorin ferrochelatase